MIVLSCNTTPAPDCPISNQVWVDNTILPTLSYSDANILLAPIIVIFVLVFVFRQLRRL